MILASDSKITEKIPGIETTDFRWLTSIRKIMATEKSSLLRICVMKFEITSIGMTFNFP